MARSKKPPVFKDDPSNGMSQLCPECGAELPRPTRPCRTCGNSLDGRFPVSPGMPRLSAVPAGVWAGILEIFLALWTAVLTVLASLVQPLTPPGGGGPGQVAVATIVLAPLSIQIALIPGLLRQRRWAPALYLWSLTPVVLVTLVLVGGATVLPVTTRLVAGVVWLGVTALQAYLVVRGDAAFTN